jgi:hypothetical protein
MLSTYNLTLDESYQLKAPKGRLHKGPNYTAYKRENLGSIPKSIENIIVDDKSRTTCGFSSQSERFSSRSESVKNGFPGPGSYSKPHDFDYSVQNTSFYSTKGYGNFASTSERFSDRKDFNDTYMPGPGQYQLFHKASLTKDIETKLLYQSLYKDKAAMSLKEKIHTPGPGYYNPILGVENVLSSDPSHFFKSHGDRFKVRSKGFNIAPGKYYSEGSLTKANNSGSSYYFKDKLPVKENNLRKFMNIDETTGNPGPGSYDLRTRFGKDYEKVILYQKMKSDIKKVIKDSNEDKKVREDKGEAHDVISGNPFAQPPKSSYVFVSKSPKMFNHATKKKHIPGPAYYSPELSGKKTYNYNIENSWI